MYIYFACWYILHQYSIRKHICWSTRTVLMQTWFYFIISCKWLWNYDYLNDLKNSDISNGAKLAKWSPVPAGRGEEFCGIKETNIKYYYTFGSGQKKYQCHGTDGLVSLAPLDIQNYFFFVNNLALSPVIFKLLGVFIVF